MAPVPRSTIREIRNRWSLPANQDISNDFGVTLSRAECAQRARWLSKDLDLSFPWIIDDVDDRWLSTYWPYGFYVGWLIDCDGKVLLQEPWGWATPETQWCGLPLASFDFLGAFLDGYLENPPPCYRGVVEGPQVSVVAAAAHTKGAGGSQWVTDLSIANPGDVETEVTVHVQRWQTDAINPETRSWSLTAGHSIELRDVLASEFAIDGNATLRIASDRPVVTVSRTYNDTPSGTFGQLVPGFDISADRILRPGTVGHLLQLEESGTNGRRTNLGLVNTKEAPVDVELRFIDEDGLLVGVIEQQLPPFDSVQLNRVLRSVSGTGLRNVRGEVRVKSATGGVIAFATSVDNRSGDPVMQIAWPMEDR